MANNKDFKVKKGIKPTVYHEAVGTVTSGSEGFVDPSNWSYANKFFDTTSQIATEQDVQFKSDGSKMYVLDYSGSIYQYSLSTAWDVSTASYDSTSFVSDTQDDEFISFKFKPDGTKVYIGGNTNNTIFQYSLSTAWDISTATYDSKSLNITTQGPFPCGIAFKPDGTKVFIADGDDINEYALSTAWDISTGSYTTVFDHGTQDTQGFGIDINDDGTKLYLMGLTNDTVFQYDLSTAYDLSTISYNSKSFSVTSQDTLPRAATFGDSGTKMYVCGSTNGKIFQYSTAINTQTLDQSTGSVFEITPTSDFQISLNNPVASGTVSAATLLLDGAAVDSDLALAVPLEQGPTTVNHTAQHPDGLAILNSGQHIFYNDNGIVYRYDPSTAYDSTAVSSSAAQSLALPSQLSSNECNGWAMSPDGTHMYYGRDTGVYSTTGIYEYSLSTAYDLSTSSYVRSSMHNYLTQLNGLYFSYDGTKAYVADETMQNSNTTFRIWQFNLNTAWNISSFSANSVKVYDSGDSSNYPVYGPRGMAFSSDGVYFYIESQSFGNVYEWECTTPWDTTTASYTGINVSTNSSNLNGGKSMYVPQNTHYLYSASANDHLTRSFIGSPATITYDSTIEFAGGTAPTSPAIGETDVLTFSTRNGGTSYQSVLAIDGAK